MLVQFNVKWENVNVLFPFVCFLMCFVFLWGKRLEKRCEEISRVCFFTKGLNYFSYFRVFTVKKRDVRDNNGLWVLVCSFIGNLLFPSFTQCVFVNPSLVTCFDDISCGRFLHKHKGINRTQLQTTNKQTQQRKRWMTVLCSVYIL